MPFVVIVLYVSIAAVIVMMLVGLIYGLACLEAEAGMYPGDGIIRQIPRGSGDGTGSTDGDSGTPVSTRPGASVSDDVAEGD